MQLYIYLVLVAFAVINPYAFYNYKSDNSTASDEQVWSKN